MSLSYPYPQLNIKFCFQSAVPPAYYAHLAAFRARYYIEGEGAGAADAGPGKGAAVRGEAASVRPLPPLSPNIKDVMFFC